MRREELKLFPLFLELDIMLSERTEFIRARYNHTSSSYVEKIFPMKNKVQEIFNLAGEVAESKNDVRTFLLGAIAIRGDGVIVKALNSPTEIPYRQAHAEYKISLKLDYGATVYVARLKFDSAKFGMSRPCISCIKALSTKKINRIYYTISDDRYGVLIF